MKNEASVADFVYVLRGCQVDVLRADLALETEDFVDKHSDCICQLLQKSLRVTQGVLQPACKEYSTADPQLCKDWTQKVIQGISFCRGKAKSMTSGAKLKSGVKAVCQMLRHPKSASPPGLPVENSTAADKRISLEPSVDPAVRRKLAFEAMGLSPPKAQAGFGASEVCSVASSPGPSTPAAAPAKGYVDSATLEWVVVPGMMRYPLQASATGFAVAEVQGKTIETEVPNLALDPIPQVLKKPAAQKPKTLKRPAAAMEEPKPSGCEPSESASAAVGSMEPNRIPAGEYHIFPYHAVGCRKYGSWAIRQNFGLKKQLGQISMNVPRAKEKMEEALKMLQDGQSEADVQSWIVNAKKPATDIS